MKAQQIKILFGEAEVNKYEEGNFIEIESISFQTYSFNTKIESEAFLLGPREGMGWQDFLVIE